MTKEQAEIELLKYKVLENKFFINKETNKKYLMKNVDIDKVIDTNNYVILCSFINEPNDDLNRRLVENIDFFISNYQILA
jgi:hypothetical protein